MNISFPQSLFDSPYKDTINGGKNIAKNSSILFCGIARNVEKTIKNNIDRIKYLGKYFREYDIFIYENDSSDNTLNKMNQSGVNYISETLKNSDYREKLLNGQDHNQYNRCQILADCRNKYLRYAQKKAVDYICILDWDIYGWSYKGFFDSICRLQGTNIASVSSYGVLSHYTNTFNIEDVNYFLMYDSYAFRPLGFSGPLYPWIQVTFNSLKFNNPTLVRSNFGGLAIYKYHSIIDEKYEAKLRDGYVDCDHVVINDKISSKGLSHLLNNCLVTSYSKHKHITKESL